jgi:hypothetical protein
MLVRAWRKSSLISTMALSSFTDVLEQLSSLVSVLTSIRA